MCGERKANKINKLNLLLHLVFSTNRGETQSRGETSTGVVNSRYDYSNQHHELIDPLILVKTIGVIQLV